MIVENKSNKIIGIGLNIALLPGEQAVVPVHYEENPIVLRDIKKGRLTVIKKAEKETQVENSLKGDGEKTLEDMTIEELTAYAAEKGIDIGKATTREGILKKIEAVLSGQPE